MKIGAHSSSNQLARRTLAAACFGVLMGLWGHATAQDYPNKPIRLVVPWPAGGVTDAGSRALAQQLSARLSTPVIIDNKAGAAGMIGATFVAKAPADGYTLLVASAETHGINPHTFKRLAYDPAKDFVAIAPFAINPFSIVARGDLPINTINELVQSAKANPGKYSYSSAGLGAGSQLAMEAFRSHAQLNFLHVPFQGEAPAVAALLGSQTDLQALGAGRATTLRKSGKLKVLAVMTAERYFGMPDVPTLKEAGLGNVVVANWFGVVAPAGTPAAVVERLHREIQAINKSTEMQTAMRGLGADVYPPMSLSEFHQFLIGESQRWGDIIRNANIKIELQ